VRRLKEALAAGERAAAGLLAKQASLEARQIEHLHTIASTADALANAQALFFHLHFLVFHLSFFSFLLLYHQRIQHLLCRISA
jgi:hypothetical protein